MQMLAIVAMEPPVSSSAEDVRDEKVKVLKAMAPLQTSDLVIGQYTKSEDGVTHNRWLFFPTRDCFPCFMSDQAGLS